MTSRSCLPSPPPFTLPRPVGGKCSVSRIATHRWTAASALARALYHRVTDRVWNDSKREAWPAPKPGHHLGCLPKAVCNDAVAVMPAFSADTASCRLHDEQLPQSPTAAIIASQRCMSTSRSGGAGRLASGLRSGSTCATPKRVRQDLFDMVEQLTHTKLAVIQQTNCPAFERCQPGCPRVCRWECPQP